MKLMRDKCSLPLKNIRDLFALNFVHPKTEKNYRSRYVAPRISLVEK